MSKRKAEAATLAAQQALEEGAVTSSDEEISDESADDAATEKANKLLSDDDPLTEDEPASQSKLPGGLHKYPSGCQWDQTTKTAAPHQSENDTPESSSGP